MSLLTKNIIVVSLIMVFLGIFTFHWFFVGKTMSIIECFSPNCVYSSTQVIPQEAKIILTVLVALFVLLAAALASPAILDNLIAFLGKFSVFRKRSDTFCHKFYSWLKILEKRDPQAALATARIYNSKQ